MADLSSVISQMAILFLIVAVGYVAAKLGVFPANTNRVLSQLVVCVTNPCMVLHSVLGSQRQLTNREVLLLTAIAVASYAVLIALAQVLPRLLRCPKEDMGLYRFMTVFANLGFLGFPVVAALFGENAVFYAAIFNLVFQLLLNTYGVSLLTSGEGKPGFQPKMLLSPLIVASVLAYVCYLTDFRTPALVTDAMGMLGKVTSPVCMLVIGVTLAGVPLSSAFTNWRLYVLSFVRLLVLPVGAWLLLRPFVTNPLMLGITVVMMGMPIAAMSSIMTAKYGGNQQLAASGVFLSTLLSAFTIPFLMWVLF